MGKIKVSDVKGKRIKYLQDDPIPDLDTAWQVDEETAYPGMRVEEFINRSTATTTCSSLPRRKTTTRGQRIRMHIRSCCLVTWCCPRAVAVR